MKAVVVFMLLFAAVYCHPVKRSASSSESADVQPVDTQALKVATVADVSSEEDADDNDADDKDSDSDESDENGPTSPPPFFETTIIPIINGRGDSMDFHSDYKKPVYYVDGNNIEKEPSSYKSYDSDKTEYDGVNLKVYKMQNVGLDQGMDASSGTDSEDTIPKSASSSSANDANSSQESNEDSPSSEEATTGATTADSVSSESSESKEANGGNQPGTIKSKNPEVIIA